MTLRFKYDFGGKEEVTDLHTVAPTTLDRTPTYYYKLYTADRINCRLLREQFNVQLCMRRADRTPPHALTVATVTCALTGEQGGGGEC